MPERASPPSARVSVEDYWSSLNDENLRKVTWTTARPHLLENVHPKVPEYLPDFVIELEYRLDRAADTPVPCAHCPKHQRHFHGFVLLAADGRRFLLGSYCGPKAYAADYSVARGARNTAKQRAEALLAWDRVHDRLPDLLEAIAEAQRAPAFAAVRRLRALWHGHAETLTETLKRLPRHNLSDERVLSVSRHRRDHAAEQERERLFLAQAAELAHLGTKAHRGAIAALREKLGGGEIWKTEDLDLGTLQGSAWFMLEESPVKQLEGAARRLRGYHLVGRVTQDKSTAQLERLRREALKDLDAAEEHLRAIRSAASFFDKGHLERLAAWASVTLQGSHRSIAFDGRELIVKDVRTPPAKLALPEGWTPPGDLFLELKAQASG